MLTREIMGCVALAILWVNTLLIVAAAAKELLVLEARRARLKLRTPGQATPGYGLLKGRVREGNGPEGALARHRVEQVGRSAGEPGKNPAIVFADRRAEGEVLGGSIALDGEGEAMITPAPESPAGCEVWVSEVALRDAAACPSDEQLDAALVEARKARGFARAVEVALKPGQEVWIAGEIGRRGSEVLVTPSRSFGMLVSAIDPRPILAKKIALSIAAIAGMLGGVAGVTALALTQPHFGPISTLGGALCLGFFIAVQPVATALREAVLLPHRAFLRGAWTRARRPAGAELPRPERDRRRAAERAATATPKAGHPAPPPAA
jgi:hypothetical protein